MQNDQFIRFKALDRCFRDVSGGYSIYDLIDVCTKAIRNEHGEPDRKPVSQRTIEKDIEDARLKYGAKFREGYHDGHRKLYQYEDTSFSLMKEILADGNLEKQLLHNVLDALSLYQDVPQYKWLYLFLQERVNGIEADQTQVVEFQNNPKLTGMEHFNYLLDAIIKKQPLQLTYKPFGKDTQELQIHPYMLKQYNNRWYLIARLDQDEKIRNYPVDRIKEIKTLDIPYQAANIDFEEYYKPIYGVTRIETEPIEDIIIRFKKKRFNYVSTKPIHCSQEIVHHLSNADYTTIKLHMQINNELESLILSFGNDAEVLAPVSFRERIGEKIKELAEMYKTDTSK